MLNTKSTIPSLLVASAIMMLAGISQAAQPGPYLGLGFGATNDEVLAESDAGTKFFGGINITSYLGLEVSYVDLGEYANNTLTQEGVTYEIVGYLPLDNHIDLYGKFGLFDWEVSNGSATNKGDDVTYGVGISVRMNDNLSLRGEWQTFLDVDGGDVDMLSANVTFNF